MVKVLGHSSTTPTAEWPTAPPRQSKTKSTEKQTYRLKTENKQHQLCNFSVGWNAARVVDETSSSGIL